MLKILIDHLLAGFFIFSIILILFAIWRVWFFFRNPERKIPQGSVIVSPADGKIIYIRRIQKNQIPISIKNGRKIHIEELMDDPDGNYHLVIGIYMTPISVHYNRIPVDGIVSKTIYRNSSKNRTMLRGYLNFLLGLKPFEEECYYIIENERNTTVITGERVKAAIVQIADKWIRRIVSKVKEGDRVSKGEVFGMIRMGSQCDLFLRIEGEYEITVYEGENVLAGSSVLVKLL